MLSRGETTHYILRVASAPSPTAVTDSLDFQVADASLQIQFASAKCVRCAPLKGKRLTTFCASLCSYKMCSLCTAPLRGPPIGGQENDRVSYLCSAPYTLSRFAGLPLKGKRGIWREKQGVIYFVYHSGVSPFGGWRHHLARWEACHMTLKVNPVTLLASPLGEEGHEVAKGCTRVRMIMILDADVTAEGGIIKLIAP